MIPAGDPRALLINSMSKFHNAQKKIDEFAIQNELKLENVQQVNAPLLIADEGSSFFTVPQMDIAGIATTDGESSTPMGVFFRREEVSKIWREIDSLPSKKVAFFQGQPGTGKSTATWRKCLDMAREGSNILWIHLDREGIPRKSLYFQGIYFYQITLFIQEDAILFTKVAAQKNSGIPLDTVIVDGASAASKKLEGQIRGWVTHQDTNPKSRAIFTASTKVEQLRSHENTDVKYMVVHSWELEEYYDAAIDSRSETATHIYEACADLWHKDSENTAEDDEGQDDVEMAEDAENGEGEEAEDDEKMAGGGDNGDDDSEENMAENEDDDEEAIKNDDDAMESDGHSSACADNIRRLLEHRYKYCGGSARWMFNYSLDRVETKLRDYCNSVENRTSVLNGDIGPTSKAATNYFFGSAKTRTGGTEYFLVSMRAVEILAETTQGAVLNVLYPFARKLQNPSFMGWVVEADFFEQVEKAVKTKSPFEPLGLTPSSCSLFTPRAVCGFDHTKNKNRLMTLRSTTARSKTKKKVLARVKQIAAKLMPPNVSSSIACKPKSWSQGGYDIFFVEKVQNKLMHIHLRFGQVTKGAKHSLKGVYLLEVIRFFETAGYTVDSIEFAFILTCDNKDSFELSEVDGVGFMKDYQRFKYSEKWEGRPEQMGDSISKYELLLSS